LEDKEKPPPQIKSPTEIPGLEKKKSSKAADDNIEITAEELNEVKNLPDIVRPPSQNKERRASTKEPVEEVKVKYEKKTPSYQKPVATEISKNKEIVIETVEKEQESVQIHNNAWKVSNEEKNLKVVKLSDNQRGKVNEEVKQEEYFIVAEEENQEDATEEIVQADEESSEDEEEEDNSTAPSDKELEVDKSVLVKKLEKGLKKKQKIQYLIEDIKSNKYIKALGDKVFGEIINFFKLKLEVFVV